MLSSRIRVPTLLVLALAILLLVVEHPRWARELITAAGANSKQASKLEHAALPMTYWCGIAFEAPFIPLGPDFICREPRCTGNLERLVCTALKSPFAFETIALLTAASISRAFLDPIWVLPLAISASYVGATGTVVSARTA